MVKSKPRKRQSVSTSRADISAASTSRSNISAASTNRSSSTSSSLHSIPPPPPSADRTPRANVSTRSNVTLPNQSARKGRAVKRIHVNEQGVKFQVSQKIIREIKRLQKSLSPCIPRLPFSRVIREIMYDQCEHKDLRIQLSALQALHESTEYFLVAYLEDAHRAALHARRMTIMARDIELVRYFRGRI